MAIAIQGLAPLLQVFDMPRSIAFYRDMLGFQVVGAAPDVPDDRFDWALLRRDGVELMLNTAYEADARPPVPILIGCARTAIPASISAVRTWIVPTRTSRHCASIPRSRESRPTA